MITPVMTAPLTPVFYVLAAALFAAAQLVFFLANQPLCDVSGATPSDTPTREYTSPPKSADVGLP